MSVTQHRLHRSVRAELTHTAPALGGDDQTLVGVRVADMGNSKPVHDQAMHSTPAQMMGLAAPAQGAMPQPPHLEAECAQSRAVARHAEVLALLFDGSVHSPSELDLDRLEFGSQAFGTREPQDHELALPGCPAAVREPEEVEGLRFALSHAASVIAGKAPELDQPRLLRVQLQPELAQPLGHLTPKALSIAAELEPGNPIVGIPHHDHVTSGMAPPPLPRPQVERVVQVDIGQQRGNAAALHRSQFTLRQPAVFQYARVQQSSEPRTTTAFCRLSYAIKRRSHIVDPHRSAGHARRDGISLGPPPSLHHLRRRRGFTRSLVRQLLRYYAAVRLPAPVAHRCTPLGFSTRSGANASQRATEGCGTSRFPSKVFPCLHGVCDRAGSGAASPMRQPRCGLRLISTASAPRTTRSSRHGAWITRLNTRPARSPVNASPTPLRMCTHDSRPP